MFHAFTNLVLKCYLTYSFKFFNVNFFGFILFGTYINLINNVINFFSSDKSILNNTTKTYIYFKMSPYNDF